MEQLQHFSHEHLLSLVKLHPDHNTENSDNTDENEDTNDCLLEECDIGKCKMCKEEIQSFHLYYYSCKDCDYSLHKFCAQLPATHQNHPLHLGHDLTLSVECQLFDPDVTLEYTVDSVWPCDICGISRSNFYNYHCSICKFTMDIICATMCEQKMDHPSHPHQLQRNFGPMHSICSACGSDHIGTFYHCVTCSWFKIYLECALSPAKLLIQQSTNGIFSHSHLLNLAYSFPYIELKAKHIPKCRVCDSGFRCLLWHYRCNKCQYYVHVDCVNSTAKRFKTILMRIGLGNFKEDDHPNLIRCPFPDESVNLLMHHFINKGELIIKGEIDGQMFSHPHPLILIDTLLNGSVSLHDPMKKVELLCDGCVRPITALPFYKCSQQQCDFVLHEWCTRLPSEIQHHQHPEHTLVLIPKIPGTILGIFWCNICHLPCNGFAYRCMQCEYNVDLNCSFIPHEIEHEAHPKHLLLRCKTSAQPKVVCKACNCFMGENMGFHCPTCEFYLHTFCALLLPKMIRHRYDAHPLSLRYYPVENHIDDYFCEICEDEFDPTVWFYHCNTCALSMHTACSPLKLQCEQSTSSKVKHPIFGFYNVKFGGIYETKGHPHPVIFAQGINDDGECGACHEQLQYHFIFKCFRCKYACHLMCIVKLYLNLDAT